MSMIHMRALWKGTLLIGGLSPEGTVTELLTDLADTTGS